MGSGKRPVTLGSSLRDDLPRILVLLGIAFMVLGALATIGLVAGDTSCNAATNPYATGGVAPAGFCGHEQGFLGVSFFVLVAGAAMVVMGTMVLPTLRERDARAAAQRTHDGVEDVEAEAPNPSDQQ
jgi:Sec-independent protein translocase protein TatA